jgi:hypothetical protein
LKFYFLKIIPSGNNRKFEIVSLINLLNKSKKFLIPCEISINTNKIKKIIPKFETKTWDVKCGRQSALLGAHPV